MQVTIYKNCKLNNKYKDVFYNKTYLNNYLLGLSNVVIINDSEIYSRNNDKFYVDADDVSIPDFKQYNYIKIEDTIGTFYAFIDSISWINNTYVISYSEDIMSNYIEEVRIRNSLLTGCKSLKLYKGNNQRQIKYYDLPVQPKSNDFLSIEGFNITDTSNVPKMCIVAKIQFYQLSQAGKYERRDPVIGVINTNTSGVRKYELSYTTDNLEYIIKTIINNANSLQITTSLGNDYYYEIDKLYVIPYNYIDVTKTNLINQTLITLSSYSIDISYFSGAYLPSSDWIKAINNTYQKTLTYDRKNISVGTFTKQINLINNGTNVDVKIITYILEYGISIILNVQSKIIDITEDFELDIPFEQVNASTTQLQRMERSLQYNEIMNKIQRENNEIARNYVVSGSKFITDSMGSIINAEAYGLGEGIYSRANFGGIMSSIPNIMNAGYNMIESEININSLKDKINILNRKVYSNSQMLKNNFSYINGLYGLTLMKIVEDNTTQVDMAIKFSGYTVREIVGDVIRELDYSNLTDNYEVLKFDEVNVYGIISQEYIAMIEKILLSGVRIWCKNDIGDLDSV